jgi:signal peptidase I
MRKAFSTLLELIETLVVAFLVVFIIRSYIIQPFLVWGSSMAPTFLSGDYILIDELSLYFREPQRGEVVVFRHYSNSPTYSPTYFIKRIIGLPNEKVLIKDNKITIFNSQYPNGFVLEEKYLNSNIITETRQNRPKEFVLGPDEYFVLGDNRQFSYDSRDWGVLKRKDIVGIAKLRLWPLKSVRVFAAPSY